MSATSFNCSPSLSALTVFPNVRFPGPGGPSAPLWRRSPGTTRLRAALFSAAVPSLSPVIVPRERGTLFGKVSVNSPGSWRERRPGEASFGGISQALEPALFPGSWAPAGLGMHLPVPGKGRAMPEVLPPGNLRPRSLPRPRDHSRRQSPETPRDPPVASQPLQLPEAAD